MNERSTTSTAERHWLPFRAMNLGTREVLLLAAAATSMLAGALAFPSEFMRAAPDCPLHRLTSLYCASCGTTRAIVALLSGHWMAGLRYNFLFTSLLVLSIPAFCITCTRSLRERRVSLPSSPRRFAIPFVCVAILFMIVRNLPFAPWNLLAP